MFTTNWKKLVYAVVPMLGALGALGTGCGTTEPVQDDEHVGATEQALTAEQCNYFAVNGKVQICHRTASQTKPYTILKISEAACVNAHALHAGDYVAVNDPNCQGSGCLPQGAPCDPTVPCCDGFSCNNGTCTPNVSDHCSPSPCQHGGSCVNDANGYTCACPAGYTGTNCETEIDECETNPCLNGQCLDALNAYVCQCDPGYTGTNCELEIDECETNPCLNGDCTDLLNSYQCECLPGYTGTNCETEIDECETNPCLNGQCLDALNAYVCQCDPGYTGTNCELEIDECETAPCLNSGTCIDGINSYTCQCPSGWGGTNCEEPACPCQVLPEWQPGAVDVCFYGGFYGVEDHSLGLVTSSGVAMVAGDEPAPYCYSDLVGDIPITSAQLQACQDLLRQIDAQDKGLCAACLDPTPLCPSNMQCISQPGYGVECQ